MDAPRRLAATTSGAAVVVLGALAWAFAATAMAAVQAAEARALGPGHTAEMPGEDELALVAHDARLAGMVVVAAGLALVVAGLPRHRALLAWSGGACALVVANATFGRAVDDGPVLPAAVGLVLATGAGVLLALVVAARRDRGRAAATGTEPETETWWPLTGAGVLGAGTLPVLQFQGMTSERYAEWMPPALLTATLLTAVGLLLAVAAAAVLLARGALATAAAVVLTVAAAAALLERPGDAWQVRDDLWSPVLALVLASAPLVLLAAARRSRPRRAVVAAAGLLVAAGALLVAVPQLLVAPLITGGFLGLLLTGPAGAYVNYDGLPVVGGGVLLAALLAAVLLAVRGDGARVHEVQADGVRQRA